MHTRIRWYDAAIVFTVIGLVVGIAAGFGGHTCSVSGTITRDGKPLVWPSEEGQLVVLFVPVDRKENQDPIQADTDRATGTFRIPEIQSGKYRVAIYQFGEHHMDVLQTKFDPFRTPLVFGVDDDGQVIDIDLPKELPR